MDDSINPIVHIKPVIDKFDPTTELVVLQHSGTSYLREQDNLDVNYYRLVSDDINIENISRFEVVSVSES